MITELFYPKELKTVIADLRAKDDLNEGAMKELNYQIRARLALFFVLASIFLLAGGGLISWIVLCVIFVAFCWDIYIYYESFLSPYLNGFHQKVEILEIIFRYPLRVQFICKSSTDQSSFTIGPLQRFEKPLEYPKIGSTIYVYWDEGRNKKAMPDIRFFKNKFCLSKTILEGETS